MLSSRKSLFVCVTLLAVVLRGIDACATSTNEVDPYSKNRLIVSPVDQYAERIIQESGGSIENLPYVGKWIVHYEGTATNLDLERSRLLETGLFRSVDFDYLVSETGGGVENNASEVLYERLNELDTTTDAGLPQIIAILSDGVDYSDPEITNFLWKNPGEFIGNGVDDDNNGWIDDTMVVDCTAMGVYCPSVSGNTGNELMQGILIDGYPFELDESVDTQFIIMKVLDDESIGYHSSLMRAREYLLSTFDLDQITIIMVHRRWQDSAYPLTTAKSLTTKSFDTGGDDQILPGSTHNLAMGTGKMGRVTAGSGGHILYIKDDGMVFGFGPNEMGELGGWNWDYYAYGTTKPIFIASDAIQVSSAEDHTLIVKKDHSLWGSGFVNNGAIGNHTSMMFVELFRDVVCASAGRSHSLFVQSNGFLWGMGSAAYGKLGIDSTANHPDPVFIASDVVFATTSRDTSFFIKSDSTLWGMGRNYYGELGDGTSTTRITPVMIDSGVRSISTGEYSSMYVKTDGTLWAMGRNQYQQMGHHLSSYTPYQLDDHVMEVSVGYYYSAYLKDDGSLWITGGYRGEQYNIEGMVWLEPTPIMENVSHFAIGWPRSSGIVAVTNDGKVWLMGSSESYYVASGRTNSVGVPIQIDDVAADPDVYLPFEGAQLLDTGAIFSYTSNGSQVDGLKFSLSDTSGMTSYYESEIDPAGTYQVFAKSLPSDGSELEANLQWLRGGVWNTTSRVFLSKDSLPSALPIAHTEFEAGDRRSFFIDDAKRLWGVGINPWGTLGGNPDTYENPVLFKTMDDVEKVAVGKNNTAFIRSDGTLWTVGSNAFEKIPSAGECDQYTPVKANSRVSFVDVALGDDHIVALKENGELLTIGRNNYGQLGDGTGMNRRIGYLGEVASGVTAVACGTNHTLFLRQDGSLWGFGHNEWGQLGTADNRNRYIPQKIAEDVAKIAAGGNQSYFIKSDGTLWGMGQNAYGQLGLGNQVLRWRPFLIAENVQAVSAGENHTLFVDTNARLWGMGNNDKNQLGSDGSNLHFEPIFIARHVVAASAGLGHTLFKKDDGTFYAMGANDYGQLANSNRTRFSSPAIIYEKPQPAGLNAPQRYSILASNQLFQWSVGENDITQWRLTIGSQPGADNYYNSGLLGPDVLQRSVTDLPADVDWIYARLQWREDDQWYHNDYVYYSRPSTKYLFPMQFGCLYLKLDHTLWGIGKVPIGAIPGANYGQPVFADDHVVTAAAGYDHMIYLKDDGSAWTTGGLLSSWNLGFPASYKPEKPAKLADNVKSVAAGSESSFIVKTNGELWGAADTNFCQLGKGRTRNLVLTFIDDNVEWIKAGDHQTMYMKKDGRLFGMGLNNWGQLGTGTAVADQCEPVEIPLQSVKDVAFGGDHTIYLTENGDVWTSGNPGYGRLGFSSDQNQLTIVKVAEGAESISAGNAHSIFLKRNGELWGMGSNESGRLGVPGIEKSFTPILIDSGIISAAAFGSRTVFCKSDGRIIGYGRDVHGSVIEGTSIFPRPRLIDQLVGVPFLHFPSEETSLLAENQKFIWRSNGSKVGGWRLTLGSYPGGNDIYDSGEIPGGLYECSVPSIPQDGSTVYARLYWTISSDVSFVDRSFRTYLP